MVLLLGSRFEEVQGCTAPQQPTATQSSKSRLALVVLLWSVQLQQAPADYRAELKDLARLHPGCYFKGYLYRPQLSEKTQDTETVAECKLLCKTTTDCVVFSYWNRTGECHLAGSTAQRVPVPQFPGMVSGFRDCPDKSLKPAALCVDEKPRNGFPGFGLNDSNAAWPSGQQPFSLQCWPQTFDGANRECNHFEVLEDTKNGWPGKCRGLREQPGIYGAQNCREVCEERPLCSTWLTGSNGQCLQGQGSDCYLNPDISPESGQRLQHGRVRVLMNISGWQIIGLTRTFPSSQIYFKDERLAADACRKHCYSDISCQYWQYAPRYGCWVEDTSKGYSPGYPLTLDFARRDTPFALDCQAGEYIQHYCPAEELEWPVHPACAVSDVEYVGKTNSSWNHSQFEITAGACQMLCRETEQCAFFTYWPSGTCRLQAAGARGKASHEGVLSGPPRCGGTTTQTTSTTVRPGVQSGRCVPLDNQEHEMYHYGKFNLTVHNLDFSLLTVGDTMKLESLYRFTIAKHLGVDQARLMPVPKGQPARIALKEFPPSATLIIGYVRNRPPTSCDFAWLTGRILSLDLADSLRQSTINILGMGSPAIKGDVQVISRPVEYINSPLPEARPWPWWWPLLGICCVPLLFCPLCLLCLRRAQDRFDSGIECQGWFSADSLSSDTEEASKTTTRDSARKKLIRPPRRGEFIA